MVDATMAIVEPRVRRRPLLEREFFVLGPARGLLGRVARARASERVQESAARSMERINVELATLSPLWGCLHHVATADGAIDHLAIGPGGVFAISARVHPGQAVWVAGETILVDGQVVPYVRAGREQAEVVGARLGAAIDAEVPVMSLVMIVGQKDLEVRRQPLTAPVSGTAVNVVSADDVPTWLASRPESLTADQVEHLLAAARRRSTWEAPAAEAVE